MRTTMCRPVIIAILVSLAGGVRAQDRHWAETESETIWRDRYTNCDKGWAVDLPKGVVAHAELPPVPHHGFLVSAADPDTTAEITLNDQRIVDFFDEYDALELRTARAWLDWELKQTKNARILEIRGTTLRGQRGVEARYSIESGASTHLVKTVIVVKGGVVYHLLLRTIDEHYRADSALFARIRAGFRFLPIPEGECVNP